jgi:hypothetical protein
MATARLGSRFSNISSPRRASERRGELNQRPLGPATRSKQGLAATANS